MRAKQALTEGRQQAQAAVVRKRQKMRPRGWHTALRRKRKSSRIARAMALGQRKRN